MLVVISEVLDMCVVLYVTHAIHCCPTGDVSYFSETFMVFIRFCIHVFWPGPSKWPAFVVCPPFSIRTKDGVVQCSICIAGWCTVSNISVLEGWMKAPRRFSRQHQRSVTYARPVSCFSTYEPLSVFILEDVTGTLEQDGGCSAWERCKVFLPFVTVLERWVKAGLKCSMQHWRRQTYTHLGSSNCAYELFPLHLYTYKFPLFFDSVLRGEALCSFKQMHCQILHKLHYFRNVKE